MSTLAELLTWSLTEFAFGSWESTGWRTEALDVSQISRTTSLTRQQSIPSCLVSGRLPQGLMLSPISFNILNNNMNDVTENTLSKCEGNAKQRVKVDRPNSRASAQQDWKISGLQQQKPHEGQQGEVHVHCKINSDVLEKTCGYARCQVKYELGTCSHYT